MRCFVLGLALCAVMAAPPDTARADDREIAEQIVSKLKAEKDEGNLRGFNIDLEIKDGEVYLTGYVSEPQQETLAIEIARHVDGVKRVYNGLELKAEQPEAPTPANSLRNSESTRRTASAEQATPQPAAPAPFLLQRAVMQTSPGEPRALTVAQTQAEISIPPAGFSSREIAEHIIGELKSAKDRGQLQGFAIDVEVRRGEVWLKGQVSNPEQEQLAVDIARRTNGVKKVINALKVASSQSESQPQIGSDESAGGVQHALEQRVLTSTSTSTTQDSASDTSDSDAIAREVLSRLQEQKRQGSLRNFGIDVQVDKQTVWLSGYVSSKEQEQLVLDVARYTPGVGQVVNDLTITGAGNHSASATSETVLGTPIGQLANPAPATGPQAPAAPMQAWAPNAYYPAAAYGMAPGMMQPQHQTPLAFAPARPVNHLQMAQGGQPQPISMGAGSGVGIAPARFDHPQMPGYAWPSYAAYPNYAGVTYPQQYSASAWPYIGPFYPYPQVPLGWRRVTLEWDDGWWHLKFKNKRLH